MITNTLTILTDVNFFELIFPFFIGITVSAVDQTLQYNDLSLSLMRTSEEGNEAIIPKENYDFFKGELLLIELSHSIRWELKKQGFTSKTRHPSSAKSIPFPACLTIFC